MFDLLIDCAGGDNTLGPLTYHFSKYGLPAARGASQDDTYKRLRESQKRGRKHVSGNHSRTRTFATFFAFQHGTSLRPRHAGGSHIPAFEPDPRSGCLG